MKNFKVAGRCARPGRWLVALMALAALGLVPDEPAAALDEGQRFSDWTVGCEKLPGDEKIDRCFIYQTVVDKDDKPVMQMAVGYLADNAKPAAVIAVPLGVLLAPGMGIKVDGGDVVRFPYERCVPQGCTAGLPLDENMIGKFKRGSKAEVLFHDGSRLIPVPISLNGFTKGFDALKP